MKFVKVMVPSLLTRSSKGLVPFKVSVVALIRVETGKGNAIETGLTDKEMTERESTVMIMEEEETLELMIEEKRGNWKGWRRRELKIRSLLEVLIIS